MEHRAPVFDDRMGAAAREGIVSRAKTDRSARVSDDFRYGPTGSALDKIQKMHAPRSRRPMRRLRLRFAWYAHALPRMRHGAGIASRPWASSLGLAADAPGAAPHAC